MQMHTIESFEKMQWYIIVVQHTVGLFPFRNFLF